jgi:hypothetical protein
VIDVRTEVRAWRDEDDRYVDFMAWMDAMAN